LVFILSLPVVSYPGRIRWSFSPLTLFCTLRLDKDDRFPRFRGACVVMVRSST
jgi:hypothetical protein